MVDHNYPGAFLIPKLGYYRNFLNLRSIFLIRYASEEQKVEGIFTKVPNSFIRNIYPWVKFLGESRTKGHDGSSPWFEILRKEYFLAPLNHQLQYSKLNSSTSHFSEACLICISTDFRRALTVILI